MNHSKFILLVVFAFSFFTISAQHTRRIDFNKGWKFKLDNSNDYHQVKVDDASWRQLDLPHDWSIEGKFRADNPATAGGGALPGGVGWYRKSFSIPLKERDNEVFIEFDGVYRNSEVYINDHLLGKRPNGYISFQYELSSFLHYGNIKNVISVKVDNSQQPNSRWYSGSGIYRNVWLTFLNKVHVDHWGTFVTTPEVLEKRTSVLINTNLKNDDHRSHLISLTTNIYNNEGKKVGESFRKFNLSESAAEPGTGRSEQQIKVEHPILWSIENPYLYKAVSEVRENGILKDSYTTRFGIRYFNFDINKGFSLNGKFMKILGVCDHQDLGALGSAINTRALERQLELLKNMGCNGIRTSHNPPAVELLDLCDRMGFIVMDEAFDMWAKQKNKFDYHLDWSEWHKKDLEDQLFRDRNHPSVFIWSIGNEIPEQGGDPAKGDTSGRVIARELVGIVKSIDNSRPVVTANDQTWKGNNIINSGVFDLIGYNYHQQEWAGFQERWPGKKLIITESTSALETRGQYDLVPFDTIRRWPKRWDIPFKHPTGAYTVSAYDNVSTPWGSTHEESIKALIKNDFVSGMYIWTGFDYLGEPTPYSWPARSSYFGILDLAGFPKDVYYLYQSLFTKKAVLHIYPTWNWISGDTVDVVGYYNNADEVELLLNGRSLGNRSKTGEDLHVKWTVPYEPGILKAISRRNGKVVLISEVKTAGRIAKIKLKADRSIIHADGKDLSFITVSLSDANGVTLPNANNEIQFKISGNGVIVGVDSGDPISHESFKVDHHTALNGLALCIIQSNGKMGFIKLTASSAGLESSTIEVEAK